MSYRDKRLVLQHTDLTIELSYDRQGNELYTGTSPKYEPYTAIAKTIMDCFFQFNIQVAEQKEIAALIR